MSEQTGVRETLGHHLARGSGRTGLIGGLGLAVAAVSAVPQLALPTAVFAGAATVADFLSNVYRERRDLEAKRRDNKMLFLFEAERQLAGG
jgi:hypothetical protein